MFVQIDKASSAEDLLQLCLQALESENGEAGVRERLGLPLQDDSNNGKKRDGGAVQKALLQVGYHYTSRQVFLVLHLGSSKAAFTFNLCFISLDALCAVSLIACCELAASTWHA